MRNSDTSGHAPAASYDLDSGNFSAPELKASTIKTYKALYERATRRAISKRESNPDEPVQISPMDIVDDWIDAQDQPKNKTGNILRSAILWHLITLQPTNWEPAYTRLKGINPPKRRRLSEPLEDCRDDSLTENSSRSREPGRMLPEANFRLLINDLANKGVWGARSQWFLLAGVASGARSIEWPNAKWADKEKTVLRIITAKVKMRNAWDNIPPLTFTSSELSDEVKAIRAKQGRGAKNDQAYWEQVDFERRIASINLTESEANELRESRDETGVSLFRDVFIEPEYRIFLQLHMDSVRNCLERYGDNGRHGMRKTESVDEVFARHYFNPARHCIWRACKSLFPDGTLYSLADARSTFSANRKAQLGLLAASRELGHAGITTSRDYYARANKAWRRYQPKPKAENAQKMNETDKDKNSATTSTVTKNHQ